MANKTFPGEGPLQTRRAPFDTVTQARARIDSGAENGKRALTERGRNAVVRILKCATDIFVAEGYGGLTMRKVALNAGIALSNLQHYFPTREALFAALMRQTITEYAETNDSISQDTSLTAEERLEKIVRLLIEDDKQPRTQSLFINMWALAQTQDFAREIMDEAYAVQRRMIRTFVEAVNPDLLPSELSCRAALITCQIEGLLILIPQRNRFPSDVRGIEDEAVRAILALARAESSRSNVQKARPIRP
ncbi:TetR/AcrR family transcriptional regulator [Paraburkholderia sp. WC7.3g]|uniref:TetR/AcrR family transcriptional regulator n=1 Tax=Paraburkholderia sp. WC7.3g TaxID=2991070 RepID=UPI003D1BA6B4